MCELPDTINYHFTAACNMRCRFCFAGFRECSKASLEQHRAIIREVAKASSGKPVPYRLNFVGGEPTVYPFMEELLLEAKSYGLNTSIVSNGFDLVRNGLPPAFQTLGLLGLSIDSLRDESNRRMGRTVRGSSISASDWMSLFDQAASMNLPIKINTTVSDFNAGEDLSAFIIEADPIRWKVFQAMAVEGQNSDSRSSWEIDIESFDGFISRHQRAGASPIVEPADVMRGSYAMISPDGRFFDSTTGAHRYSDPVLKVGVEMAWSQVNFDRNLFDLRTASFLRKVA